MFGMVHNMPQVMNMPNANVINMSGLHRVLNMPEYA